jgi:HSP20 family protein
MIVVKKGVFMHISRHPDRDRRDAIISRSFSPLFDDFFRLPDMWEEGTLSHVRGLTADVYETENEVVAEMAVPGVKPDDISISVTGDTLTVSGESKEERKEEKKDYYQKQIRYGSFAQSLILPSAVEANKAQANFKHGVLKITIPKSEEAKPKQIKIKVEEKEKK